MNDNFKPFRLINDREIKELQQSFSQSVLLWNEQYALFPLSCSLGRIPNTHHIDKGYVLGTEQKQPIALLTHFDLSTIKTCLFGDESECFDAISQPFFIGLLNQLLGTHSLEIQASDGTEAFRLKEWFYAGAPSLILTLKSAAQSMRLYLHPQWVLNALSPHETMQKSISHLCEALDPHVLRCQVDLNPVSLPLEDIIRLQVGDVIKTDHPLTAPLLLQQNQQTVCHVEIGEIDHYKSIQITSSL